jgi:hypothetical protein
MIRIAVDTPKELIDIFKQIDLSKIPTAEHDRIIDSLKSIAEQYIPIRTEKVKAMEIDLPGCPQRLAIIVSQFDFNKVGAVKKSMGLKFIKKFLKDKKLLKN